MGSLTLVSVVVTCYNQGRYVAEAIESIHAQTYEHYEIIVVDDGSTDDTASVVSRYPRVRVIHQSQQGLSSARNAGLRACAGGLVVFLDADDRLLPNALMVGLQALETHSACAFVYGRYRLIAADGSPLPTIGGRDVEFDHYLAMLRSNYIGMHAAVMYRRSVLADIGGFNPALGSCEDYDVYLRITRAAPVYGHGVIVAEYRQHSANMSRDNALMLRNVLAVLRSQWTHVRKSAEARASYAAGVRNWQNYCGRGVIRTIRAQLEAHEWSHAVRDALVLLRFHPRGLAELAPGAVRTLASRASR